MAKRKLKLSIRIPEYQSPRNLWRQRLHGVIASAATKSCVFYHSSDKLELNVKLYLEGTALCSHDVGNRLEDIMDTLQGRIGGSKKIRRWAPIIPNDKQIYQVTVKKALAPKQSRGLGYVLITRHKNN